MTIKKNTFADVVDNETTGENAAFLTNDNKRAVNETIDEVNRLTPLVDYNNDVINDPDKAASRYMATDQQALDGAAGVLPDAEQVAKMLEVYKPSIFAGGAVALFSRSGTSATRIKIRLPFKLATSAVMLSFSVDIYSSYQTRAFKCSGYLWPSHGGWYSPAVMVDSANPVEDVVFGVDGDGYAYISVGGDNRYAGLVVRDVVYGYGNLSNYVQQDGGWIITENDAVPNAVAATVIKTLNGNNTTVDSNGFIKQASPIINLFDDKIEGNATDGVTMEKTGTGVYVLDGVEPLAESGWYIETPKDRNGNIYFTLDYEQNIGEKTLTIRTYTPDYSTGPATNGDPVDILPNRFVSLRFNEVETPDIQEDLGENDVVQDDSDEGIQENLNENIT